MDSSTRHGIVTKLYDDSKFLALTSNCDRVQYVLEHVISYSELCATVMANLKLAQFKCAKNLTKAISYKAHAEAFWKLALRTKDLEERANIMKQTRQMYLEAILYTPPDQFDFLSQLYARMSQVHCKAGQYQAGLYFIEVAIELAEENNFSPKAQYFSAKATCLQKLGRQREASKTISQALAQMAARNNIEDYKLLELVPLQLATDGDDQTPETNQVEPYFCYWIDERCSIQSSPNVGRHYVAKAAIRADEVILKEKPYSMVMESEARDRCHECYHQLGQQFYPCRYCTELVFCNSVCFRRAYEAFHRFECGGLLQLVKSVSTASVHIFRMMSRAGGPLKAYQTQQSLAHYSIEDYLGEEAQRVLPEWEKTAEEKARAYKMATILWAHEKAQNDLQTVHHVVVGLETAVLLDLAHSLRQQRSEQSFFVSFVASIITDFRRILYNVFGWQSYDEFGEVTDYVANCQALVGSLINHSCVCNVTWAFEDGVISFTANQNIREGDELTITYGPSKSIPYFKRQQRLNHYRFVCRCHACYEDALQGANLRCHSCSGPVVIESALDLEPALYGRCLLCYEKYEDIENAIKLLKSTKKSIESTHVLAKTAPDRVGTLQRVIEQTQILMDLSIVSSMFNRHHIELISITIELMGQTFEQHYSWAEKMRLALLFCKHLAVEVPADVVNGKMLSNLHFWMQTLQRCIGHFYQVAKPSFSQKEEMNMWNGMLAFHSRLARAIGSLEDGLVDASDKEKHLLERLVERQLTAKRQLVDAFLRQFQPQGAQLKIYGYNMWLRLGRRQVV